MEKAQSSPAAIPGGTPNFQQSRMRPIEHSSPAAGRRPSALAVVGRQTTHLISGLKKSGEKPPSTPGSPDSGSPGSKHSPTEDRRKSKASPAALAGVMRAAALAYVEADVNNDGMIQFEEFDTVLRRMLRHGHELDADIDSPERIRELFDSIDTDHSGVIKMDEYFMWSLSLAKAQGCGLEAIFHRYDKSGEGTLDVNEFALAVEDMGFPSKFAMELFIELDNDGSGAVSHIELIDALLERSTAISKDTKKFLTCLAFSDSKGSSGNLQRIQDANRAQALLFDARWHLTATDDPEALRTQYKQIRSSLMEIRDLL